MKINNTSVQINQNLFIQIYHCKSLLQSLQITFAIIANHFCNHCKSLLQSLQITFAVKMYVKCNVLSTYCNRRKSILQPTQINFAIIANHFCNQNWWELCAKSDDNCEVFLWMGDFSGFFLHVIRWRCTNEDLISTDGYHHHFHGGKGSSETLHDIQ